MDKGRKKELREQYAARHPDMGIVCWQCGDELWAAISRDADKDHNRSEFQLKLGTWPDRELQSQYALSPDDFRWVLAKKLDYEDTDEDHSEELQLLLLEFLDEHPEAKPMKPGSLKV